MYFKYGVPFQILAQLDNWIIYKMKIPQKWDTTLFFIYQLSNCPKMDIITQIFFYLLSTCKHIFNILPQKT